ncbi:hypothetical protein [Paenibacillus chitinolyticus]|uniref:hypothetical protein n=1 Tax=Paenibacillus chitinolyticus TaxID=79263 RepID=UPI003672C81E
MITKEHLMQAAKFAKENGAYVFLIKTEEGLEITNVPVKKTTHYLGSIKVEFDHEKYTFDNVHNDKNVIKVYMPDSILKDTSLQSTLNEINKLTQ